MKSKKQKKDNSVVHGVDCKYLGSRYAAELVANSNARVFDLPCLQSHGVYRSLEPEQQQAVRNNIKYVAQDMLILAGYAPETVARVLDGK
jgi:hypothetical protein